MKSFACNKNTQTLIPDKPLSPSFTAVTPVSLSTETPSQRGNAASLSQFFFLRQVVAPEVQ